MTDHPLYRKHYADDKTYLGLTMKDPSRPSGFIAETPGGMMFQCEDHEDGRAFLESRYDRLSRPDKAA